MTAKSPEGHYHNRRIYRPLVADDGSLKFLQFMSAMATQAKATRKNIVTYTKNLEISLLNPSQLNYPAEWDNNWATLPSNDLIAQIMTDTPESCRHDTTLEPLKVKWLGPEGIKPADNSRGILAVEFKDPNPTIEESEVFVGAVSRLSGGNVLVKDSAGMFVFANSVPYAIGQGVMTLVNKRPDILGGPFTFAPASFTTWRPGQS